MPRDREGEFFTEVFERYQRMTGDVEEAVLEMYLQGVSTRRVSSITQALSRVKVSKDAVSRIAKRLEEEVISWRERPIEQSFPYLILDACYLKVRWGDRVGDLALLVAVGISEEGYRPGAPTKPLMSVLEVLAASECCWGTQGSVPGAAQGPTRTRPRTDSLDRWRAVGGE